MSTRGDGRVSSSQACRTMSRFVMVVNEEKNRMNATTINQAQSGPDQRHHATEEEENMYQTTCTVPNTRYYHGWLRENQEGVADRWITFVSVKETKIGESHTKASELAEISPQTIRSAAELGACGRRERCSSQRVP